MNELSKEKFLSKEEVKMVRDCLQAKMLLAKSKGNTYWVRPYYIVEVMINSGLRVSEACKLKFKDLAFNSRTPSIEVVNGKGGKNRIIYVPSDLKRLIDEFREWKSIIGEPIGENDYIFLSHQNKPFSTRAIQIFMKKVRSELRIKSKCTPHSLRHSFAVYLYGKEKDLRLVQKQLGHSNIQTTTIYADTTPESASKQVEDLWKDDV